MFSLAWELLGSFLARRKPQPKPEERAARAEVQRDEQIAVAQQQERVAKAIQAAPQDEAETAAVLRKGEF